MDLTPFQLAGVPLSSLPLICSRLSGLTGLTMATDLMDEEDEQLVLYDALIKASRLGLPKLHLRDVCLSDFVFLSLLLSLSQYLQGLTELTLYVPYFEKVETRDPASFWQQLWELVSTKPNLVGPTLFFCATTTSRTVSPRVHAWTLNFSATCCSCSALS